jgi:hypothetical protein
LFEGLGMFVKRPDEVATERTGVDILIEPSVHEPLVILGEVPRLKYCVTSQRTKSEHTKTYASECTS